LTRGFHHLLAAPYFVLFLFSVNAYQLGTDVLWVPLLVSAAGGLLAHIGAYVILRRWQQASLLALGFWVLFLTYGRLEGILAGVLPAGMSAPVVGVAYLALLLLAYRALSRTRGDLHAAVRFCNIALVVLCLLAVGNIAHYTFRSARVADEHEAMDPGYGVISLDLPDPAPDIYYIVLDGYPAGDILEAVYDYDNQYFLDALASKGFYVAESSRSNYPLTFLSLASALNFRYLDELPEILGTASMDQAIPHDLIRENDLVRTLQSAGYRFVHFNSGWGPTTHNPRADVSHRFGRPGDQFPAALLDPTPLAGWAEASARRRILETFDALPAATEGRDTPTFAFAHIMPPHPPYLLDRDGKPLQGGSLHMTGPVWSDRAGYTEQMRFVNRRVLGMIGEILDTAQGETDPIILLLSDHGTAYRAEVGPGGWGEPSMDFVRERTSILAALHVPDSVCDAMYPEITPVNAVRAVLREHLGAPLDPLPDRVYFSDYHAPYDYRDVTDLDTVDLP